MRSRITAHLRIAFLIDSNVVDAQSSRETNLVPLWRLEAVGDAEVENNGHGFLRDESLADLSVGVGSDRRGVNLPTRRVVHCPGDPTWRLTSQLRYVPSKEWEKNNLPSGPGSYS